MASAACSESATRSWSSATGPAPSPSPLGNCRWGLAVQARFAAAAERHGQLLFGVNRVSWPGRKWTLRGLAELPHIPVGTVSSIQSAATASPADVSRVIEQAYDLAERELPGLDAGRLRRIFRFSPRPQA